MLKQEAGHDGAAWRVGAWEAGVAMKVVRGGRGVGCRRGERVGRRSSRSRVVGDRGVACQGGVRRAGRGARSAAAVVVAAAA